MFRGSRERKRPLLHGSVLNMGGNCFAGAITDKPSALSDLSDGQKIVYCLRFTFPSKWLEVNGPNYVLTIAGVHAYTNCTSSATNPRTVPPVVG